MPTNTTKTAGFPLRNPDLITLDEAGTILRFHPRSVRRLIAEGRLRGYRVGDRAIRVRRADVLALIERV